MEREILEHLIEAQNFGRSAFRSKCFSVQLKMWVPSSQPVLLNNNFFFIVINCSYEAKVHIIFVSRQMLCCMWMQGIHEALHIFFKQIARKTVESCLFEEVWICFLCDFWVIHRKKSMWILNWFNLSENYSLQNQGRKCSPRTLHDWKRLHFKSYCLREMWK